MWYHEHDGGTILQVKIIPRAKRNEIVGLYGDFLKIKIAAPSEKGRANAGLVLFIARLSGIASSQVKIVRGHGNPLKIIFVPIPAELVSGLLLPAIKKETTR